MLTKINEKYNNLHSFIECSGYFIFLNNKIFQDMSQCIHCNINIS